MISFSASFYHSGYQMNGLAQFWEARNYRERVILGVGGTFFILIIAYMILLDPALTGLAKLNKTLPALRVNANRLEQHLSEARDLQRQKPVAHLPSQEMQKAILQEFSNRRLTPAGNPRLDETGSWALEFKGISYAAWSDAAHAIEHVVGARFQKVDVAVTNTPGLVDIKASIQLSSANGSNG